MPFSGDSSYQIDLTSRGSEKDIGHYLRYYADEDTRRDWIKDWPNDVMPAHEVPPFDRDRHLPACDDTAWRNSGQPS